MEKFKTITLDIDKLLEDSKEPDYKSDAWNNRGNDEDYSDWSDGENTYIYTTLEKNCSWSDLTCMYGFVNKKIEYLYSQYMWGQVRYEGQDDWDTFDCFLDVLKKTGTYELEVEGEE